jgi:hypothetical protein
VRGLRACGVVCSLALLAACGEEFTQVSHSGFGAFEPALATLDDSLAIVWNDNRGGNDEIYLRLLDGELRPLSAELRLTESPALSYEASVVNLGGDLAIAWYEREPSGRLVTKLGLWTPQGEPLWQHVVSSPERSGRVPVVHARDDSLFIAWVEESVPGATQGRATPSTIRGAWFRRDGTRQVEPFDIADASRTTWNLNLDALPDGRIVLVYDAEHSTRSSELYLALIGIGRAIVMPLSDDDGFASKYPDIAVGARLALTWYDAKDGNADVYLALFDTLGATALVGAQRVTHTDGESIGAYLAWNGARLGLAWNDDTPGQHEIQFQAFDTAAQPLHAVRRLTHTPAHSRIPAIVAHREGFVLAWNEAEYGSGGHDGLASTTLSEVAVIRVD